MVNISYGERVRRARQRKGISQAKLGNRLRVSQATISLWERDEATPTIDQKKNIKAFLEKSWKETNTATGAKDDKYAFVAMAIDDKDPSLVDVLEAIKDAAAQCGVSAMRIDEEQSNDKITDRILAAIRKAYFVIVDLTNAKPNVFFEAGFAHGIRKIPIYVARNGTPIQFDVKDYPVIMFGNMKELREKAVERLKALYYRV